MARGDEDREGREEEEGSRGRTLAIVALVAVTALIGYVLLFGGDEYEVTANFENASQLVDGAQVTVAGRPVGTVKSVELAPDNTALVTFTVGDELAPLPQGTQARVNPPSLSSVAGKPGRSPTQQFEGLITDQRRRCPGANERNPATTRPRSRTAASSTATQRSSPRALSPTIKGTVPSVPTRPG